MNWVLITHLWFFKVETWQFFLVSYIVSFKKNRPLDWQKQQSITLF